MNDDSCGGGPWAPAEDDLARSWRRGQAACEGVVLEAALLVGELARRLPPAAADLDGAVAALCVEDLYLACARRAGAPGALALFERRYVETLPRWLAALRPTASFIDDVRMG